MASNRKIPPELIARAAELIAQGQSLRQAARAIGCSHPTLLKWLGPSGAARDVSCSRSCQHWDAGRCGLGFPEEDWSVRLCGAYVKRSQT